MDNYINFTDLGESSTLEQMLNLFNALPDVYIYAKDLNSKFIYSNQAFAELLGTDEENIIGHSDPDYFEENIAQMYLDEDATVFAGKNIVNKKWMVPDSSGVISWYLSTKLPLKNSDGRIFGLCGLLRDLKKAGAEAKPYFDLSEVIEYVNKNYMNKITSTELADILGLSVSQLDRKFKSFAGVSPMTYLLKVRINEACRQLAETEKTITEIHLDTGFQDQSYFCRQFKKFMGTTPRKYRLQFI